MHAMLAPALRHRGLCHHKFLELAQAIQEMAVLIKGDKDWMPFEFGVRPSQLVNIDPDGGVVEL